MEQSSAGDPKPKRICRRNSESNWSELLPELLLDVGKRLDNRIDVSIFRSVCKNWRSSLPLPQNPNLPLHQFQFPKSYRLVGQSHEKFTLALTTVFLVQPLHSNSNSKPKCWILSVEERKSGKFRVLYPLSGECAWDMDPNFPKLLNFAEFRVSEIGKGCISRDGNSSAIYKVVLCSNSAGIGSCYRAHGDCTAIVLFADGTLRGLDLGNGRWTEVGYRTTTAIYDILWHDGVVYAVDEVGRLYTISNLNFQVSNVTNRMVTNLIHRRLGPSRLVESSGEVYLVALYRKRIYKLNRMQCIWEAVTSLGNRTVYLGCDACFMIPTQSLLGHDGDYIVFHESMFDGYCLRDIGFHEADEGLGMFMYCFRAGVSMESELDLSYQAISSSLWPPPTWLWDAGKSLQCVACKATIPSLRAYSQSQNMESYKSVASKVEFEGVEIRSDLVSTLQEIWAEHGNLLEGSSVHSKEMLKSALKSLAKAVTILESSAGRALTESQCDDLISILMDLKYLQLRVEWLEPLVEKAVKHHQSQPMVDAPEDRS